MAYLLDTHAFLWYFQDSKNLSQVAQNIIEDANVRKFVSVASLWEFSIKFSLKSLHLMAASPIYGI